MRKKVTKIEGRSKSSKSIILTSDMHVGHKYALHTGEFWKLSDKLKPIKELWYSAKDRLIKKRANLFFINGEHVDGDNPKEGGHQCWSTDLNDQFADARTLLKAFTFDAIGMNRGSNYHTTKGNTGFEELFLNSLSLPGVKVYEYSPFNSVNVVEWDDNNNKKIRVDDLFVCEINGKIFHIMHHVGGSRWFNYIPMAISREGAQMKFYDGKLWNVKESPNFVVRSHTHKFCWVEFGNTVNVVTPSWKIFDRFGLKSGQEAGTVGLIEIVIEPNGEFQRSKIMLTDEHYPKLNIIHIQ